MSTGRFYTGRNVKGQALDISYINSRTLKRASSEQALDELIGPYIYIYIYINKIWIFLKLNHHLPNYYFIKRFKREREYAMCRYHFTIKIFKYILKITIFVPTIYVEDIVSGEEKLAGSCESDKQLITVYNLG